MKGRTIIKLKDTATGEVQTVEDCNMFTKALDEVLNRAPFYFDNPKLAKLTVNPSANPMAPVAGNALGGLLLFPQAIDENIDTIFAPATNKPTGIASFDAYSGEDARRGSFDEIASGPIENGYKFVWNFSQNQANGPIACACLTSKRGGQAYWDGGVNILQDENSATMGAGAGVIQLDATPGIPLGGDATGLYFFKNSGTAREVIKFDVPQNKITLTGELSTAGRVLGTISDQGTKVLYNGELWNIKNSGNASGNAVLNIDKYNLGTWEMTTQQITVPAKLEASDAQKVTVIIGGYLYMIAYGGLDLVKINLATPADVSLIEGFYTESRIRATKNLIPFNGGGISSQAFFEADGTIHSIAGMKANMFPIYQEGVWLVNCVLVNDSFNPPIVGCTVITPYLATINNLQNAINKNPQQTMTVEYIVTEE